MAFSTYLLKVATWVKLMKKLDSRFRKLAKANPTVLKQLYVTPVKLLNTKKQDYGVCVAGKA